MDSYFFSVMQWILFICLLRGKFPVKRFSLGFFLFFFTFYSFYRYGKIFLIGLQKLFFFCLFGIYNISTFVCYLIPSLFLYK